MQRKKGPHCALQKRKKKKKERERERGKKEGRKEIRVYVRITIWSSKVFESIVTQKGVPISSFLAYLFPTLPTQSILQETSSARSS